MDKAKHKAAMDALNDLILSELQGGERHRFASVKRLSEIAQKLLLADTGALQPEDAGLGDGNFGLYQPMHGALVGAGDDQAQMVREMMSALGLAMSSQQESNVAREREATAKELNQLLAARKKLSTNERALVTERINEILDTMKETYAEDGLSLVPAVDVRRHQAGTIVVHGDEVDPQRPLTDGEGCDSRALQEGGEGRSAHA